MHRRGIGREIDFKPLDEAYELADRRLTGRDDRFRLCELGYLENYEKGEAPSLEDFENLNQWGRCTGCIEEYGTDGYPDR